MKKINKKNESFHQRFGLLFDYIVKRREQLVNAGRNQKPEDYMRYLLNKFTPYRGYQWKDRGAATFLKLYYLDLLAMISPRETNKRTELENLHLAAEEILITLKHQKKWQQLSAF